VWIVNKDTASVRTIRASIMVPASITTASLANVWMDTQVQHTWWQVHPRNFHVIFLLYFQENIAKLTPRSAMRQCVKILANASKGPASHSIVVVAKVGNNNNNNTYVRKKYSHVFLFYRDGTLFLCVQFEKDGPVLFARWTLTNAWNHHVETVVFASIFHLPTLALVYSVSGLSSPEGIVLSRNSVVNHN